MKAMFYEAGLNRTEETKDDPLTYLEILSAVNIKYRIHPDTKKFQKTSRKYRKYWIKLLTACNIL
jgi:hypothetical protein